MIFQTNLLKAGLKFCGYSLLCYNVFQMSKYVLLKSFIAFAYMNNVSTAARGDGAKKEDLSMVVAPDKEEQ